MVRCVEFTDEANTNADEIFEWIGERSADGAARWKAALALAIRRIAESAETLPLAQENDEFSEDIREVLFKTRRGRRYRLLFIVRNDIAYAISVRGSGQDFVAPDNIELPEH